MTLAPSLRLVSLEDVVRVADVGSPLGVIHVASVRDAVCAVNFDEHVVSQRLRRTFGPFFRMERGDPLDVAASLRAYFNGDVHALAAVPIALRGTPLQRHVWTLVRGIAAGSVTTYAALAAQLGMPRGQRAIGVCLATNPVPLFVPCHRVVSTSGGLTTHPAGTLHKRWLLRHEGALAVADLTAVRSHRKRQRKRVAADDRVDIVSFPRVIGC